MTLIQQSSTCITNLVKAKEAGCADSKKASEKGKESLQNDLGFPPLDRPIF